MKRGDRLLVAGLAGVAVCASVLFLSSRSRQFDTTKTIVIGKAASDAPLPSSGLASLAPYTYEANGALTISVGDIVDSNGLQVGVTDFTAPYSGTDGSRKAANGQFVLVKAQVHNSGAPGDAPLTVSSADTFELRDGRGQVYPPVALPGAPAPPNGQVAPGQTLDGALVYDVPSGQTYQFHFKSNLLANGDIAVNLGKG